VEGLLKNFLPNEHVKTIFDIKPEQLKEQGIKGIITDLDNTLVPWDVVDATPGVIEWFKRMEDQGISIMIISNNKMERVKIFSEQLGTTEVISWNNLSETLATPYVFNAKKPLRRAFKRAANQMDLKKNEIVVIGDQLLTDVLGGNLAGFYTILVVPIVQTDAKITKINRTIERRIL